MPFKQIAEVAALQPLYSSSNTPEMQRRGILIRREIPVVLRNYEKEFRNCLGRFGNDLFIEAKDGMGRKTEAPWIRLCSKQMSPSATDGYYVVMHFSADGTRMYVTVGCGSTIWKNGELLPVNDEELKHRTSWAYQLLSKAGSKLSDFPDTITLGAKAPLPALFEKATICSKLLDPQSVEEDVVVDFIQRGLRLLKVIYEYQSQDADKSLSQRAQQEIEDFARPNARISRKGQGYALSGSERRAIEDRAMAVAQQHLESLGFSVQDTSANKPYDFLADDGTTEMKIEVKGTTSNQPNAILMTRGEVELHNKENGKTGLIVVHSIELKERASEKPMAAGGIIEASIPWDIEEWNAVPIAYSLERKDE